MIHHYFRSINGGPWIYLAFTHNHAMQLRTTLPLTQVEAQTLIVRWNAMSGDNVKYTLEVE